MKEIIWTYYQNKQVLLSGGTEKEFPMDNEVVISLRSPLHSGEPVFPVGKPLYTRIYHYLYPIYKTPMFGILGHVEAVGRNVRQIKVGDKLSMKLWWHGYVCGADCQILVH